MHKRESVEVTKETIRAGVELLVDWKHEMDYMPEEQAVEQIYRAMAAISAVQSV